MQWILSLRSLSFGVLAVGAMSLSGCNNSETAEETTPEATAVAAEGGEEHAHGEHGHEHGHGGWWCGEHGVPEEVCARCDTSLIADFKKEGDWCEEHARPESQCFICGPERFEKFAARYKAKMGEEPPKPEELAATGS